ncbi:Crp/Fnr family transcriptional regulator [Marinomonas sp. 15G1-11]|uniref:Crp/Fnr family transcriptional regulator n=1 Tax=Marinomonas phaeophyticola TaxID=3004091 RepID=A0ABT4JT29_9GAMM|nr:Crp/Fnr family transcriptional regulator [Marinomonas sp. 15G1-11]MCZ2721346.1 Crp/Fnr family transcriptional regulator [Marinomonas sp. 15G1-11]
MAVSKELLKRFEILSDLSETALDSLASYAVLRNVGRRGIVITGGQRSDSVCFLFEGRLQGVDFTLDGREVGLYFVEPGDFCGELGLFDEEGQPESVIALAKSQVVVVPASAMKAVLQESYTLVEKMFVRMAGRVRQLSAQRALLGLPSTTGRVCGQLWMMLIKQETLNREEGVILNPPTHQELGIMLNLSRETVTRVFQTLQSKAIVKRDGSTRLVILDADALKNLAESKE